MLWRVAARTPLRGPPPERARWVPDPSRSRRFVDASSPRLVLCLRSPRHRRWVVRADGSASCSPPPGRPAAARAPHPLSWQRAARPHACAPISCSCSLSHRVHQSQPPPFRSASSVAGSSPPRAAAGRPGGASRTQNRQPSPPIGGGGETAGGGADAGCWHLQAGVVGTGQGPVSYTHLTLPTTSRV